ncbi:hypothetical protein FNT36_18610 [Hymenobacter setariae]|uniref:Uncharacterized protein n=1 Tax=Hymenobacter setariae TaxID=2594794 RepID=A0A558BT17_9BACT|nr:hypothetical protein [Hymenobacter setariae]TVT39654.1 hypothetical protein FNT36_18610 [Hymenobacter setariae]
MSFSFAPVALLVANPSYQLDEQRNEYWRSVAAYENTVLPVFLYLEHINWEAVITWHIERWKREFVSEARRFVRENNGRWAGKKFLLPEEPELDNFSRKVALPIPTPADRLSQSHAFFREVHTGMSLRDLAAAPDKRRHLAERLRSAALMLTNTLASRNAAGWEPDWELQNVLQFQRIHSFKPDEVGALLAKVEHFINCWATFHEVEHDNATMFLQTVPVSAVDTPDQTGSERPWAKIEALAERIGLRKNDAFLLAPKWIAAATAGMIDALCEAEILPASGELQRLYADFSEHYNRSIKADRVTPTRAAWQRKARKELGLE